MTPLLDLSGGTDSINNIHWVEVEGTSVASYFENAEVILMNKKDQTQPTDDASRISEDDTFGKDLFEAKQSFERGETASYEEVFGHPQPEF